MALKPVLPDIALDLFTLATLKETPQVVHHLPGPASESFLGMTVIVDPALPPGVVEFRMPDGRVVGRADFGGR